MCLGPQLPSIESVLLRLRDSKRGEAGDSGYGRPSTWNVFREGGD